MRKPEVAETPIIAELRDRLLQEGPRTEMNRVLARLNATETAPVQGHATMPELKSARSESPVSRSAIAATVGLTAAQVVAPAHASDPPETPWPRLQRVFFATNSVSISAPDDGLHKLLADARQSDEIWIAGHTDSIGPRTANTALARRRAEAIKYILTSRGVSPERIVLVRAPIDSYIADNETETGRARNRRVEVTFVKSGGLPAGPRALFGAPAAR